MEATNVCIIDNCLKDFTGHHFEYVRSIASELPNHKSQALVLAHQKALPVFDRFFKVERVFHRSHYEWPCRIRKIGFFVNLWILNKSFYLDLKRSLQGRVARNWLLFAPNVNHQELFAWVWWLRSVPQADRPQVRLFMRWSYYQKQNPKEEERYTFVARLAFRALEKFSVVRLVTDSSRLADEYSRLTRLPIDVLPIPHTDVPVSTHSANGKPVALFLGGARTEKGFAVLVDAARRMQHDPIKLSVQCHLDDPDDRAAADAYLNLEQVEGDGIQLVRGPLETAAYYELLARADIVVLPYLERNYRSRTSGILVEALAAGKPVVVTSGTWMADQALQARVGLSFTDGNSQDLRRAILEVASSLDAYRRRASDHRSQWVNFHNPSRLVEMLLS